MNEHKTKGKEKERERERERPTNLLMSIPKTPMYT